MSAAARISRWLVGGIPRLLLCPLPPPPIKNSLCTALGAPHVRLLFQAELTRTVLSEEHPSVCLFLPSKPEHAFLNSCLAAVIPCRKHAIQILQVFPMSKMQPGSDAVRHNLNVVSAALPPSLSACFHYQAFFYYDNCMNDKNYGILYPYYAVFNSSIMLFSLDMEDALLCRDKNMVQSFQSQFNRRLCHCREIICSGQSLPEPCKAAYTLGYSPCLIALSDPETAVLAFREDTKNLSTLLQPITKRLTAGLDPEAMHCHYFTEQGLIEFARTGFFMELPRSLSRPLAPRHRLALLDLLQKGCCLDRPVFGIVNTDAFRIPRCLSLTMARQDFSLLRRIGCADWDIISIQESGILMALDDFFSSLPGSPYVYTKAQALSILEHARKALLPESPEHACENR